VTEVPERGDLAWLIFTPQLGREQPGHRPALVLSPQIYHERSELAVVCPITSDTQPWPWMVLLPDELPVSGAVLVDQVRSIDRGGRKLRVVGRAPRQLFSISRRSSRSSWALGAERER
jgi:mRNA interferase MazF